MDELEDIRKKIDDIDKKLAELFIKRMSLIKNIADIKKNNSIDIYDHQREIRLKETIKNFFNNKILYSYYEGVLNAIINSSKNYQRDLIDNERD